MYIHHFLFCSFYDKSAHTLKLQSMRGKKGKGMDSPPSMIESWLHQMLPKEICPVSVLFIYLFI